MSAGRRLVQLSQPRLSVVGSAHFCGQPRPTLYILSPSSRLFIIFLGKLLYFVIKVSWKFLIAQKQLNVIQLYTCYPFFRPKSIRCHWLVYYYCNENFCNFSNSEITNFHLKRLDYQFKITNKHSELNSTRIQHCISGINNIFTWKIWPKYRAIWSCFILSLR